MGDYLFRTQITLSRNPLQASGPGPLLHSSVLQSVLQPLLLQYTTVLKSVLQQYHNSADVCTSWCSTHAVHNLCLNPIEPLTTWHSRSHSYTSLDSPLVHVSVESTRTGISRPPERISTPAVPPCLLLAQTNKTSSAVQGSMQYSEKSCLGEAPPSVCLRCWNFFLHMTIYSGLRLHSQGTPLQANGPGPC